MSVDEFDKWFTDHYGNASRKGSMCYDVSKTAWEAAKSAEQPYAGDGEALDAPCVDEHLAPAPTEQPDECADDAILAGAKALFAHDKIRVMVDLPEEIETGAADEDDIEFRDAAWGDKIYGHNPEDYIAKAKVCLEAARPMRESGTPTIADYEATLADHRRLVRELDVALNGDDAAQQASLCDIVSQVKSMRRESGSDNG